MLSLKSVLLDCQQLWAKHLPELGDGVTGQERARLSAMGRQLESCLNLMTREVLALHLSTLAGHLTAAACLVKTAALAVLTRQQKAA